MAISISWMFSGFRVWSFKVLSFKLLLGVGLAEAGCPHYQDYIKRSDMGPRFIASHMGPEPAVVGFK